MDSPIDTPLSTGGIPRSGSTSAGLEMLREVLGYTASEAAPLSTPQSRPSISRLEDEILKNQRIYSNLEAIQSELEVAQIKFKLGDMIGNAITAYYVSDALATLQDLTKATVVAQEFDLHALAGRAQLWKAIILHDAGATEDVASMVGDLIWLASLEDFTEADCFQLRRILAYYDVQVWQHVKNANAKVLSSGNGSMLPDFTTQDFVAESHDWLDRVFEHLDARINNDTWPGLQESLEAARGAKEHRIVNSNDQLVHIQEQMTILQAENAHLAGKIAGYQAERKIFGGNDLKTPSSQDYTRTTSKYTKSAGKFVAGMYELDSELASRSVDKDRKNSSNVVESESPFSWHRTPTRLQWGSPKLPSVSEPLDFSRSRRSGSYDDQPHRPLWVRNATLLSLESDKSGIDKQGKPSQKSPKLKNTPNLAFSTTSSDIQTELPSSQKRVVVISNAKKREAQPHSLSGSLDHHVSPKNVTYEATAPRFRSYSGSLNNTAAKKKRGDLDLETAEFLSFPDDLLVQWSRAETNDKIDQFQSSLGKRTSKNRRAQSTSDLLTGASQRKQGRKRSGALHVNTLMQLDDEGLSLTDTPSPTALEHRFPNIREHQHQQLRPIVQSAISPILETFDSYDKVKRQLLESGKESLDVEVKTNNLLRDRQHASKCRLDEIGLVFDQEADVGYVAQQSAPRHRQTDSGRSRPAAPKTHDLSTPEFTSRAAPLTPKSKSPPSSAISTVILPHASITLCLVDPQLPPQTTRFAEQSSPGTEEYPTHSSDFAQGMKAVAVGNVPSNKNHSYWARYEEMIASTRDKESSISLTPFLKQLQTDQETSAGYQRRTSIPQIPSPLRTSFAPNDEDLEDDQGRNPQAWASDSRRYHHHHCADDLQAEVDYLSALDVSRSLPIFDDMVSTSESNQTQHNPARNNQSAGRDLYDESHDHQPRSMSVYDKIGDDYPSPIQDSPEIIPNLVSARMTMNMLIADEEDGYETDDDDYDYDNALGPAEFDHKSSIPS